MNVKWSVEDILKACNGRTLHPQDWFASGVNFDSRQTQKGDLFIALEGTETDGHHFVHAAIDAGAAGALVHRQVPMTAQNAPLIFVEDTYKALYDLARFARERVVARVVAVTGSVGKTTNKEMLRLMLGANDDCFANEGNLNNHVGVPLTLARMPSESKFAVIEMGMNHAGEIAPLSRLARPDVALVTNIEPVHIEAFASLEDLAAAKAEIFEGFSSNAAAVFSKDSACGDVLMRKARSCGIKKILNFSGKDKADAYLLELTQEGKACFVQASVLGKKISFRLELTGQHFVLNALGSLLVCAVLDSDLEVCAQALSAFRPLAGRGQMQQLALADGLSFMLLDESYNASPPSMRAALARLAAMSPQGRKVAVLGDMLELGTESERYHSDLADDLLRHHIDAVYACGEQMRSLYNAIPPSLRGGFAETSAALAARLPQDLQDGDSVMVKGSHGMKMDKIIQVLKALEG
ncbi:MAG: UDP-N-acetylmuramoyl-tripeptide--D-alanyl-D-alanine ligase [Alphaproteobacteria bacterium]|nr:UDP-N-acetylmuramoyl-tripeptide--D-alanyl-D-alanine ligase [Alphaproteobacteria bacterium]